MNEIDFSIGRLYKRRPSNSSFKILKPSPALQKAIQNQIKTQAVKTLREAIKLNSKNQHLEKCRKQSLGVWISQLPRQRQASRPV